MECKKVQEMLLTDYIDDQMDENDRIALEGHLSACRDCRSISQSVKEVGPDLFINAGRLKAPETVWNRIKETILSEQKKETGFLAGAMDWLRSFFYVQNSKLAFATLLTLLIIAGTIAELRLSNPLTLNLDKQEQAKYLYSLRESMGDATSNGEVGYETVIEEYFL